MEKAMELEPMIRRAMTVEDVFMKNEEERRRAFTFCDFFGTITI